jgi:protein arginine N-methyltransferase 5
MPPKKEKSTKATASTASSEEQEENVLWPDPYYGVDFATVADLPSTVESVREAGFDFCSVPLSHPRARFFETSSKNSMPMTRSDMVLRSQQWTSYVMGRASEWISMDSSDASVRTRSEQTFNAEIAWAAHLNLQAVLLPPVPARHTNYARLILQNALKLRTNMFLYVPIPVTLHAHTVEDMELSPQEKHMDAAWLLWNRVRLDCDSHTAVQIALVFTAELPTEASQLERWVSEPVKTIILPTHIFLANKGGHPVLSKRHQQFLQLFLRRQPNIIITGRPCHPNATSLGPYAEYVRHLHAHLPGMSEKDEFEYSFYDYLQAPLQPLADHLESATYEVFERDPIKYKLYEDAVYAALTRHPALKERGKVVEDAVQIMVVGAGRGPLVRASIRGSQRAKRKVRIVAVEKNPNAVITLRNEWEDLGWEDLVEIVASDMRLLDPAKYSADILVSELLGSFGDNELSPECLDGAQRLLKVPHGISIPYSSTSYLAPVSTHRVWTDVRSSGTLAAMETPYVVLLKTMFEIAAPKPCFHFVHPNPFLPPCGTTAAAKDQAAVIDATGLSKDGYPVDNDREITLEFTATESALMHGFIGYFETSLYEEIFYGILPERHSPGLISWFPLFFPLRNPITVLAGDKITAHVWRRSSSTKVWYEWAVSTPQRSGIVNPNGRSYWIGKFP